VCCFISHIVVQMPVERIIGYLAPMAVGATLDVWCIFGVQCYVHFRWLPSLTDK
jgi:hypothetical protein